MKKYLLAFIVMVTMTAFSNAQDYSTGIGLRGGLANGITIKHFIGGNSALEGIVTTRWQGFNITGLYELHSMQVFDVNRLNFYYGLGGHIGFYNGTYTSWGTVGTSYTVIGVDGILGLEYNFVEVPINLSVDWKPALNLIGNTEFWPDDGAFSVRYIF
ncbi:MAG: hypothetical protein WD578_08135 [Bacteroidales bacterium]